MTTAGRVDVNRSASGAQACILDYWLAFFDRRFTWFFVGIIATFRISWLVSGFLWESITTPRCIWAAQRVGTSANVSISCGVCWNRYLRRAFTHCWNGPQRVSHVISTLLIGPRSISLITVWSCKELQSAHRQSMFHWSIFVERFRAINCRFPCSLIRMMSDMYSQAPK